MTKPADVVLHCTDCDREVEGCSLCEREACDRALCYRCMVLTIGQAVPEPHGHGG
ncbi:MAG TPA: hypothetical protein VHH92_06225 [Actinomycetota bacterium]|nr:hypothetical protein [Actinomycetota bacterium]